MPTGIYKRIHPVWNKDKKMERSFGIKVSLAKKGKPTGNTKEKSPVYKHGMTKTNIYGIWAGMKQRCLNKNHYFFKHYGGRGIKVCDEWLVFENFYKDMGERPKDKSLDRIDNNGNYCKENCRWATPREQHGNTRLSVKYKGENASNASRRLGGGRDLVSSRLFKGWNLEEAFTYPFRTHHLLLKNKERLRAVEQELMEL